MEARRWIQPSPDFEMRFSLRASSAERNWSGFQAATYDVSAGIAERGPSLTYTLVMHLGEPAAGSVRLGTATNARLMCRGNMDLVPLGYSATWLDRDPGTVLNVRLDPAFVRSTAIAMGAAGVDLGLLPPLTHLSDAQLEHLGWALVAELETADRGERLFAESVGVAMTSHLIRRYARSGAATPRGGLSRRQFDAVKEYINANLAEDFGLADLAKIAGLSASHFKTLFKRSAGQPVHQYVVRVRVEAALRLLSSGKARLSDVAQQAGFSHQSHMSRHVRRMLGVTPAELLRRFR